MIGVSSRVRLNMSVLQALDDAAVEALEQTAEALHTEVVQAQVMPFDSPETVMERVYGKRGQFAKNGREYKGKLVKKTVQKGGTLQNESTFVDNSDNSNGRVSIISSTPYARRLYFHPEYHFDKEENPNAQGRWYEPWISGKEKEFCQKTFAEFYRRAAGTE